ncbi:sensor histidine kinase [uncultured Chitinophaga sp.]|uniref:sensor histidine kinase n=1 Tax=uncultured Chitinophaga sp. TaxID=339340 RepID=UPI0025EAD373|nr:histidine kinase [uncultured Chitinophaga sp.]
MNKRQHILFNVLLFIGVGFMDLYLNVHIDTTFSFYGISFTLMKLALFYINYQWLHPRLLSKKKYLLWLFSVVALVLSFIVIRYLVEEVLYLKLFGYSNYFQGTTYTYYFEDNYLRFGTWIIIGSIIRFIQDWLRLREQQREQEKQHSAAEISFLKSQINPHFLFNTLNSIYSLSYQHSEKAPAAILKLSEIMRYMLYDTEEKLVPLDKEIQYLRNFVELQKMRFKEAIYADLLVEGAVMQHQIAPLLLIAFVENAFKHGILNDPDEPVLIQITVEGQQLQLYVQNKINQQQKDQTGGIGIANIKRRLELLYPGRHELKIDNNGTHYICELTLQLA